MATMQNNMVVNGTQGTVYATLNINGTPEVVDFYQIRTLTATINFNNVEAYRLGELSPMYIQRAWNGTGSMEVYYGASLLDRMVEAYIKRNTQVQFSLVVTNDDANSRDIIGTHKVRLNNVKPESYDIAVINVDDDFMVNSFDFVFEGVDVLKHWDYDNI